VTSTPTDRPPVTPGERPTGKARRRPGRADLVRIGVPSVAAALGGVLLYLSCAPRTLWWLALPAFALLWLALRGQGAKAGAWLGLLFGLGYFLPLLPWVGIYVGAPPWLALSVFEALLVALGAAAIAVVRPLPWGPVWGAALWVATEALAARVPFGGFAWGKVAFSQADGPFVRLAAIGGTPLVSFGVVLTGFALAALGTALLARRNTATRAGTADWARHLAPLLVPVLVALLAPSWLTGATRSAPPRTRTVAVVQGNVPRLGLDFNAQRRAVLDYHVRRTLQLADDIAAHRVPRPDLVIWPENSSDIDPLRNSDAYAEISAVDDRLGVPLLVGAVLVADDGVHTTNTSLVWEPGRGPVQRNDKRRVLPFGEYLPWRSFFELLSPYAARAGNFLPGHGPGVVTMAGVKVGVAICWEIAFDDTVLDSVRNGAQLLTVPTNNATFGHSEMTFQQLAMSRLRAVEHDRAVVVAATTGESAIITPDGRVVDRTPLFTPAAMVRQVPLLDTTTLSTRFGAAPEWLLTLLGLVVLGARLAPRTRIARLDGPVGSWARRRSGTDRPETADEIGETKDD
jgi:apolipoprotein N-acyltransferase